jgi:hypothetical protein
MGTEVIQWMIAGCVIFVMFLFFYKAFLKLLAFCAKGVAGGAGFMLANALLGYAGVSVAVGVNIVTCLATAALGFPGFILLYAVQLVLK